MAKKIESIAAAKTLAEQLPYQRPTIARIVHYVEHPDLPHRAAIITGLIPEKPEHVNLTVFGEHVIQQVQGSFHFEVGDRDVTPPPGTWHWPERS